MSRNKCMHPRNIHPDYTTLAIKYPGFRAMCSLSLNGKVVINLKNEDALRKLTQTLLLEYFNLNVNFAPKSLIPTIPLRLNYILWIEDILKVFKLFSVHGIDIGCGSSCIYSLLAARKNNWKMIALESNETNIEFALENIQINELNNLIEIYHQKNKNVIFNDYFQSINSNNDDLNQIFDFCICNPPFYTSSSNEQFQQRNNTRNPQKRKQPKNCLTGHPDELFCDGGEVTFIQGVINESLKFPMKIRIFTTMLGHKSSLIKIIDYLQTKGIENFIKTEFCQGNITRWGVAWSFQNNIRLNEISFENNSLKENT